jgi:hypothetical protein
MATTGELLFGYTSAGVGSTALDHLANIKLITVIGGVVEIDIVSTEEIFIEEQTSELLIPEHDNDIILEEAESELFTIEGEQLDG